MKENINIAELEKRVAELTKKVSAIQMPKNSLYDQIYAKMLNKEDAVCGNC